MARSDLPLAGGKGANLGDMVRAGLPVPPGFVLLTSAYRDFVTGNGIQSEIQRLAAAVRPDDADSVEAASTAIRALFDQGTVAPAVVEAVTEAYAQLDGGLVAVRSSATAEDLPGASFAGQQETYLNIEGPEQVLAAVRQCWSSLWTPRAISYRAHQGISPADVSLAVVIQRLVVAEAAGVLFTANPVNGRRDQMVIDGAWGLGEAVVSGQVTPDHWVADGRTGTVLEARIASKEVMTVRRAGGTDILPIAEERRSLPVLNDDGVAALVDLGRRVAAHFGVPQDIEWALAGGQFYLVQSRPITSLFPLPEPAPPPEPGLRVHTCFNAIQGLVEPLTPAGIDLFGHILPGLAALFGYPVKPGQWLPVFRHAAGRVYMDITNAIRRPQARGVLPFLPGVVDRPMADILIDLLDREPRLSAPAKPTRLFPRIPVLFVGGIALRVLGALISPHRAAQRRVEGMDQFISGLERQADSLGSLAERRQFLQEVAPRLFPLLLAHVVPLVVPGMGARFQAEKRCEEWLGDGSLIQPVLRALPHNPTTEMDLALWRLSRRLKAEGIEPSADHPGVRDFLDRYGHRGVREIDVGMPRWRDDPEHVLNVLRTYLGQGDETDAEAHFRQGAADAERAATALVERVRREKGLVRAVVMRFLLSRVRALAGTREYPKFLAVRMFALHRRVLGKIGQDLVADGRLDNADDIYFLWFRDWMEPGSDLRALAAANRAEYQRELGRRSVPRVLTSEGEAFYGAPAAVEGALVGTAASPGVHEGRVRVIRDPRGAKLEHGEVLVAPGTDPAWTPLFLTAGALVMEIGGIMSHGSVVAREYGIPAVVGIPDATRRLRDGQRVRVDGESGAVVPLD
ncbi:MAG: PEP/pyruvate-binding domain-containing protein [Bacillota bacterium]